MSKILGNIELYMGPQQLGAPDDRSQVIINFIDGAQTSLSIAVQELDSRPVAEAIIRARQRSVVVKLVLEADYLVEGLQATHWRMQGWLFSSFRVQTCPDPNRASCTTN